MRRSFVSPTNTSFTNRPSGFLQRLAYLQDHANFEKQELYVRDGVTLYVFVRHEGFDRNGQMLPDDGSAYPEAQMKKAESKSADPGLNTFSSDSDHDYNDDKEDEAKVANHQFTIDMVARYPNLNDDLILHWGISRK